MSFTSYTFILFLAIVFIVYYLMPSRKKWPVLLVASYIFYYYADPKYLIFILITTISTYLISRRFESLNNIQKEYLAKNKETLSKEDKKAYKAKIKSKKWAFLLICLFINIGILCITKYTNFVISNINSIFTSDKPIAPIDMIIPMGISFYTFQSMGYIIDVYRGKQEAERNFFKLALFVSFFPQLVQGPISRFSDLAPSLFGEHKFEIKTFSYGLMRILWGYFKKMIIADRLVVAITTMTGATDTYFGTYVFVTMILYAIQLYADFTGGIDITIGIAQSLGITVAENFNLPYFSKNIKEYWNRWHITMGTWFTDYIFYPISVCGPMLKLSKWSRKHLGNAIGKRVTVYLSSFVVWFTTGFWHGAAWNFIVWGLMNYVVIMISQELEPLYAKFHKKFNVSGKPLYEGFQILRTFLLMSMIRMFDVYRDVPLTFKMLSTMFTKPNLTVFTDGSLLNIGVSIEEYIVIGIAVLIVFLVSVYKLKFESKYGSIRDRLYENDYGMFALVSMLLFIAIIVFGAYGIGYDSNQFIYNQF